MTQQKIKNLLKLGEGINVEFKSSKNALSKDVYETVCAFLNRHGGTILLGVDDSGKVVGIDPENITQIKKDFVTAINNPQKIHPASYLGIEEIVINKKSVLYIFVPESSQVHRCNGRIYDRNEDGDFDITDNTNLVAQLYQRKQSSYSENKIYPYASLDELCIDLIAMCRKMVTIRNKAHPWGKMNDLELFKKRPASSNRSHNRNKRSHISRHIDVWFRSSYLKCCATSPHRFDFKKN
ncbi:MAG: RNA-binding domain-containing protein [bacterium]